MFFSNDWIPTSELYNHCPTLQFFGKGKKSMALFYFVLLAEFKPITC